MEDDVAHGNSPGNKGAVPESVAGTKRRLVSEWVEILIGGSDRETEKAAGDVPSAFGAIIEGSPPWGSSLRVGSGSSQLFLLPTSQSIASRPPSPSWSRSPNLATNLMARNCRIWTNFKNELANQMHSRVCLLSVLQKTIPRLPQRLTGSSMSAGQNDRPTRNTTIPSMGAVAFFQTRCRSIRKRTSA